MFDGHIILVRVGVTCAANQLWQVNSTVIDGFFLMSQPSSAPKFDIPLSSLRSLQNAIRFQYNYRRTENRFLLPL
jgi:hypothetical protein